ncbi:5291_t:CDS:1, partial [Cetraspora pellucida]
SNNMDKTKNEISLKDFVTYLGPIELWSSPIKEAVVSLSLVL